jgi:hypothetical protein
MWRDEIVAEVHHTREEYAARFNNDLDAMFADWRERERQSGREVVSLPPKSVEPKLSRKDQPAA